MSHISNLTQPVTFLAIDLGASSGRVIACQWDGGRFTLDELHRFPNGPVTIDGHLHWDIERLWDEIQTGIAAYTAENSEPPAGIGIDTWAVDYVLLDRDGNLLGNPYNYRDHRTNGVPEEVDRVISPQMLYAQTGIGRLQINTLYQLASMRGEAQLGEADTFLMIPDLFHYRLTGKRAAEYTNATTTQFYDAREGRWATDLLEALDLPTHILPPIVFPGTILGGLLPEVSEELGLASQVPVIAVGTHDTASAVAAIPWLDEHSMYISSGTWSLVGIEIDRPILSERARVLNFTNEGGVGGTIRFLRNVGGLWLLQECQRGWLRDNLNYSWPDLVNMAKGAEPLRSIVDPDAPEFLSPVDMEASIRAYCLRTGQPEPTTPGQVVRCCLESLALKYRWVLEALEELVGHELSTIRVVGGGSRNGLLCQLTADACNRRVVSGPVEATALGNVLVQAVATGYLADIEAGRKAVAASFGQENYEPHTSPKWDAAYQRMVELVQSAQETARA